MIDFVIGGAACTVFLPVGILAGALYVVFADGLFSGQSLGKKLIGLRVMVVDAEGNERPCGFQDSMIRNLPYGVFFLLGTVPFVRWLFFLVGTVFLLAETYFALSDEEGIRIGDVYANTRVIDDVGRSET